MASSTTNPISTKSNVFFDILDYEHENVNNYNYMTEEEKWTKIKEDFNLIYQFDNTLSNIVGDGEEQEYMDKNTSIIASDSNNDDNDNEISDEQILSQRLSQLSTLSDYEHEPTMNRTTRRRLPLSLSTTTTTTTVVSQPITERFRTSMDDTKDKDDIPDYLLSKNKLFDQMIYKIINNSIDIEDIRQMAFFMYQISYSKILHDLWSTYLCSGTGQLKDNDIIIVVEGKEIYVDRQYWPHHVKSLRELEKKEAAISLSNMIEENEQIACENIAHKYLKKYHDNIESYQKQFNDKKQYLSHIWTTTTLEKSIQLFIEQHDIASFRMKCETRQGALIYQYEDEIIQRKFQQYQPTNYQKKIFKSLYDTELQLETAKSELIEYQQRVIFNKPPVSYDSLEILLPLSFHTLTNLQVRQQLFNRYEKLIQQTKTDLMSNYLAAKQASIYQYQFIFDKERKNMMNQNIQISESIKQLICQRSLNTKEHLKFICQFTMNYSIRKSYLNHELENTKQIGFLSNLMIDPTTVNSIHKLTHQQIQLLRRGPTYVAPCQLHITNQMISKQYAPLNHQLAVVLERFGAIFSSKIDLNNNISQTFQNLYSQPLPNGIYQRALYEKQLIQSINQFLNKNNLILRRTADQNNIFYLHDRDDFINRSNQYMENHTDHYYVLIDLSEMTEESIQHELNRKYLCMYSELNNCNINKRHQVKIDKIKLPYLYFLPDNSTIKNNSFQVKPMFSTQDSVTSKLARYLQQLLRPLLFKNMMRTIFVNEMDFIQKLNSHTTTAKEYHLKPTTLFATIKIMNFDTMDTHQNMVAKLLHFLNNHLASNKIIYTTLKTGTVNRAITIETIQKLTELYLENNIFYYNGKIYGFSKGSGPNSLLFSEILSNIYLYTYDRYIFDDTRLKTEFYGRYKNQLFFTWNQSKDELIEFLHDIDVKFRHIHIETKIDKCVQFLNAQIENRNGHLYTSVFHESSISKYILPYVVGHTKFNHSLWFRSALIRAGLFSSNLNDFKQEEIALEMACLLNGYSIDFIETQLKHFYLRFNVEKIRFSLDQTTYEQLRHRLFDFIKVQRTLSDKARELEDQEYMFNFSYPYDYGPYNEFNFRFQNFWKTYLKHDAQLGHADTKVILNTKHIFSLNTLLGQQKPLHGLL